MRLKAFLDGYYRFLKVMLTVLMVLLVVPVFLQVISRYLSFIPRYIWTEEMARFLFIQIIMIGSVVAVRDNSHFKVDVLSVPSAAGKRFLDVLTSTCMLVLALVFVVGGIGFVQFGMLQRSELAGLPMVLIFGSWPLMGLSAALFVIEKLWLILHNTPAEQPE